MRLLHGWRIREHPVSYRDRDILAQCGAEWSPSTLVVARVMADRGPIGDQVVAWRIRELLATGAVEGGRP